MTKAKKPDKQKKPAARATALREEARALFTSREALWVCVLYSTASLVNIAAVILNGIRTPMLFGTIASTLLNAVIPYILWRVYATGGRGGLGLTRAWLLIKSIIGIVTCAVLFIILLLTLLSVGGIAEKSTASGVSVAALMFIFLLLLAALLIMSVNALRARRGIQRLQAAVTKGVRPKRGELNGMRAYIIAMIACSALLTLFTLANELGLIRLLTADGEQRWYNHLHHVAELPVLCAQICMLRLIKRLETLCD